MNSSITNRMQALHMDVEPDVEERQINAMLRELREAPATPVVAPRLRRSRRRAVVTLAAAIALVVPAAALAAEDAVPGDVLYPVKQSTEWVRSLVDPAVPREHRVDELEIVIGRGAPIEVIRDRFDASIDAVEGQDPELIRRVESARQTIRDRYGVDLEPSSAEPGSQDSPANPGNDPGSGTGTQQRNRDQLNSDGVVDEPSTTTTSAPSMTTTTSPRTNRDGSGADGARPGGPAEGSTTQSTIGQPEDAREPGSGGKGS